MPMTIPTPSLGRGQTWQNVMASRAWATNYTNTTGKPICASVSVAGTGSGSTALTAYVDGVAIQKQQATYTSTGTGTISGIEMIVPHGSTYRFEVGGTVSLAMQNWMELR